MVIGIIHRCMRIWWWQCIYFEVYLSVSCCNMFEFDWQMKPNTIMSRCTYQYQKLNSIIEHLVTLLKPTPHSLCKIKLIPSKIGCFRNPALQPPAFAVIKRVQNNLTSPFAKREKGTLNQEQHAVCSEMKFTNSRIGHKSQSKREMKTRDSSGARKLNLLFFGLVSCLIYTAALFMDSAHKHKVIIIIFMIASVKLKTQIELCFHYIYIYIDCEWLMSVR